MDEYDQTYEKYRKKLPEIRKKAQEREAELKTYSDLDRADTHPAYGTSREIPYIPNWSPTPNRRPDPKDREFLERVKKFTSMEMPPDANPYDLKKFTPASKMMWFQRKLGPNWENQLHGMSEKEQEQFLQFLEYLDLERRQGKDGQWM